MASWFAYGHFSYAYIKEPQAAVEAQRQNPWLRVLTEEPTIEADITIEGDKITAGLQ